MKNKLPRITIEFFKNNPNFVWVKRHNYWCICDAKYYDSGMRHFFKDIDHFLEYNSNRFFKNHDSRSTKIGVVDFNAHTYVIKRYNQKGIFHGLKKMLRQSRALRSWINCFYLQAAGIATLKPVAVVIYHIGPWRGKTYFITEFAPGVRACDFFAAEKMPTPEWPQVIENISVMTKKLCAAHIVHDDYQYGNILLQGTTPLLLDLDHMRVYKRDSAIFKYRFRKDIQHFLKFLDSNPTAKAMFEKAIKN